MEATGHLPELDAAFDRQVQEAADYLRQQWDKLPKHAVILGTGAGELADEIEIDCQIPYPQVPHFPASTAMGHKGQFVAGHLEGRPLLAMQGRFHLYEGYPVDVATLPIHVLHRLGIQTLFVSNASGGINPKFTSGDIMLIRSHVDFMYRSTARMIPASAQQRPLVLNDASYDAELIEHAKRTAREHDFVVHEGTYASLLGPNYETRAEYRFLRRIGADVVGMSTVPEVCVANRYGLKVLGLSIVTNIAKPDVLEATSGQEVIDAAAIAAPRLKTIVANILRRPE